MYTQTHYKRKKLNIMDGVFAPFLDPYTEGLSHIAFGYGPFGGNLP